MADDYLALADVQTINDGALSGIQVSSLFDDTPALRALAAVTATNGDTHKYLDYTQAPVVGFRAVNDGREHDSSIDTLRTVTCKLVDSSFTLDQALTNIWRRGEQDLLDREAVRALRAGMFIVEKQIFCGTVSGDANGFAGLADKHTALSQAYTLGAGGSGADTSSVYFVRSNPDEVAVVSGFGGSISIGEAVVNRCAGQTGWFTAWVVPILAWYGVQTGSIATSSVRLANIDSGAKLTDDLMYQSLQEFPAGRQPNLIFMSRRSLEYLREDRTTYNPIGTPAPRPESFEGIPIIVTDGILDTETAIT